MLLAEVQSEHMLGHILCVLLTADSKRQIRNVQPAAMQRCTHATGDLVMAAHYSCRRLL